MRPDSKRERRRKRLIALVKKNVPAVLKKFPEISKLWLIGSIAVPVFFDMNSDIDIVVDGLSAKRYFELYVFLEKKLNEKFDLIMLGDVKKSDLKVLEKKMVIYEKTSV